MNTIAPAVFNFNTHSVRTIERDGIVWFVANDIAKALNYRNADDMTRVLDDDERGTHIVRTPSGDQEMQIINESGLYHALLKSRKPEAVPFRKWVTSEVLPAIRKTGSYTAKRPRQPKALPNGLTVDQQTAIKQLVRARVEALPQDKQAKAAITLWSAIKSKFGMSYKAVSPDDFAEVASLAARVTLEGELMPRRMPDAALIPSPVKRYLLSWDSQLNAQYVEVPPNAAVMTLEEALHAINAPNGMAVDTATLAEFSIATITRLAQRCQHYVSILAPR